MCSLNKRRKIKQGPTVVVELYQLPYDVIGVTAYISICDVYNVYSLTGK